MTAYYNEHDPYAAQWLRNLISAGHIAPGVVDARSIEDVTPGDLAGFTQRHFFAGVGGWPLALRRAGWPDDKSVWTGSCPCQPFSAAGKGAGFVDERHLWPALYHLITQCHPDWFLGEQVASKDGLAWLDLVLSDLEGAGYAAGAVDLCAAGVGAPHIRQRLWIVGHAIQPGLEGQSRHVEHGGEPGWLGAESGGPAAAPSGVGGMADSDNERRDGIDAPEWERGRAMCETPRFGSDDDWCVVCGNKWDHCVCPSPSFASVFGADPRPTNGFWRDADWLFCRDGKWRPVRPSTFPLAHGVPNRVGRLRSGETELTQPSRVGMLKAYGNAVNIEAATAVIESLMEAPPDEVVPDLWY